MQFETVVDGELSLLEYRFKGDDLALMHTFVPDVLRGKGIAQQLAKFALEYAREKGFKVLLYCPFVTVYIKKHPEYEALVKGIAAE